MEGLRSQMPDENLAWTNISGIFSLIQTSGLIRSEFIVNNSNLIDLERFSFHVIFDFLRNTSEDLARQSFYK